MRQRSRTVMFRVTPEEYEQLQALVASTGARCLSDLARERVLHPKTDKRLKGIELSLERIERTLNCRPVGF